MYSVEDRAEKIGSVLTGTDTVMRVVTLDRGFVGGRRMAPVVAVQLF